MPLQTVFCCRSGGLVLVSVELHSQHRPLFSADAELVVLHVTVKDKSSAYDGGLRREAFNILYNGQPQTIDIFTSQNLAATIGC